MINRSQISIIWWHQHVSPLWSIPSSSNNICKHLRTEESSCWKVTLTHCCLMWESSCSVVQSLQSFLLYFVFHDAPNVFMWLKAHLILWEKEKQSYLAKPAAANLLDVTQTVTSHLEAGGSLYQTKQKTTLIKTGLIGHVLNLRIY